MRHALLLPLLTFAVAAQSDGPFLACPLYLTVGNNTLGPSGSNLPTNAFYEKPAGFQDVRSATAPAPTTPDRPDFRLDALFPGRPANFALGAVSSDNCTIFGHWAGSEFVLDVGDIPSGAYGALLFSVTKTTLGGSCLAVANEHLQANGPGADLFSLVLPYSDLPLSQSCVPVGVAQRATDGREMGFRTLTNQRPEMRDFDPFFTFYECADPLPSYLPTEPWFYFTLSPQALQDPVVRNFTQPWFLPHQPRPATILRTRWSIATHQWQQPEVFLTHLDLGLVADDAIDALGIDQNDHLILLSLDPNTPSARTSIDHQLMVAGFTSSPLAVTHQATVWQYEDITDTREPVAKIAGAEGGGDIDGTCPVDPGVVNGLTGHAFGYIVSCRSDLPNPVAPWPVTMGASAMATEALVPGRRGYAINVSGVPNGGIAGLVIGFPGPLNGPTLGGPSVLLIPTAPVMTYRWDFDPNPLWYGVELDFQFAATDGVTIELARTVRLRL